MSIPTFASIAEADAWLAKQANVSAVMQIEPAIIGEDGRRHTLSDGCGHYIDAKGRIACGQDFMAGTICSLLAGHGGGDSATCLDCGKDWYDGSCECQPQTCRQCGADISDYTDGSDLCLPCDEEVEVDP